MKNKVILITVSSNGISRETAFKFTSENAKVVLWEENIFISMQESRGKEQFKIRAVTGIVRDRIVSLT